MKKQDPKFLYLDVETTGLDPINDRLYSIAVIDGDDENNPQWFGAWEIPSWVRDRLADPTVRKVGANTRFDLRFLHHNGFEIRGKILDIQLMAMLVDENQRLGLKELATKYLGVGSLTNKARLDEAMKRFGVRDVGALCRISLGDPQRAASDVIRHYNIEDTLNTFRLFHILREKLDDIDKTCRTSLGMKQTPKDYFLKELIPTESVLFGIETTGVRVDLGIIDNLRKQTEAERDIHLAELNALCAEEIGRIEDDLYAKAVAERTSPSGKAGVPRRDRKYKTLFLWDSGTHIGRLIYEELGAPKEQIKRTPTGKYDTNETTLKLLQIALPKNSKLKAVLRALAKYKKTVKVLGTYVGDARTGISSFVREKDGQPRVFATYMQRTNTGRLSSASPNMQNCPRGSWVRRFFVPSSEDKVFGYGDFSQVELRIGAHLSGDEKLVEAFMDGVDLHRQTAAHVFHAGDMSLVTDAERQVGKVINFLLLYDGSAKRLMQELNEKNGLNYTRDDCDEFRAAYFRLYKGYAAFLQKLRSEIQRRHVVIAENGRLRRLPEAVYGAYLDPAKYTFTGPPELRASLMPHVERSAFRDANGQILKLESELYWAARRKFGHAQKQGFNFPNQGLGATITKRAMLELRRRGFTIVCTVHDSIIVELDKSTAEERLVEMKNVMESAYPLRVPLKADVKLLKSFDEKDVWVPDPRFQKVG